MNVILSAHFDLARPVMSIKLDAKNLTGLSDNFAGIFAAYQASRKTGIPVFFTNYEELDYDGADCVAKTLDKNTLVIVVDVVLEKDVKGKLASVANAYGMEEYLPKLKRDFEKEIHFIDSPYDPTEDETWIYGKRYSFKTFYFGIPIPGDYYHATNLKVDVKTIDKSAEILTKLIEWIKKI